VDVRPFLRRLPARYRRPLEVGLFVEVPLLVVLVLAYLAAGHGGGGDFEIFRKAGNALLHGRSPYVRPTPELIGSNDRFVYPTPFALPFVPFALLPEKVGAVVYLFLCVAAVLAALWLLGVRDRRCFGVALIGAPVYSAIGIGTIGPFLLLLLAIGWRYRHRRIAGVPLALAAAAKLFVWPVLVWLVVTRRWRGACGAIATLAGVLLVWLAIDPSGMRRYPETVRVLNEVERWKSYSPQTFALSLGLSGTEAEALAVLIALLTVAAIVVAARSRGERHAFSLAIVGAVVATPILWLHYLILLLVPIALTRPRLSRVWFLPVVLWVSPHPESLGVIWRIAVVLATVVVIAVVTYVRAQPAYGRNAIVRA
jgi:MFS family permease